MKKSLVAFIVLGLCSVSFAGNSDVAIVSSKQVAAESAETLGGQAAPSVRPQLQPVRSRSRPVQMTIF